MEWNVKEFDELTLRELYKILKERTNVFVVEQNCPYSECDDKDEKSIHFFVKKKGEIIAYLRVLPAGVSYEEASLGRVFVKKEYRSTGIAKELMGKAIAFVAEEMKESKIRISAQQYLLSFYENFHFKKVGEMYLEDGIPHIEMLYEI